MRRLRLLPLALALALCGACSDGKGDKSPVVVIETSMGTIKAELYPDKAPITVKNFLEYVDAKHYDGTVFHRVIPTFMIQGGGFKTGMDKAKTPDEFRALEKKTNAPIKNEAKTSGLLNRLGTLAMARTSRPDSATAQFFINVKDNPDLDPGPRNPDGYAVFGKVIEGLEVVDKIKAVKTHAIVPDELEDVPDTDVVILSIRRAGS
jgi:cyclophilin family peptidyl-prolyl cis-trans isomerase